MRTNSIGVGVCLLILAGALGAAAQSLNCDNPTRVIPDGRLNGSSIPAGAVFWFSFSTSQSIASYSVEANFPQGAATMPTLGVFAPGDVGAGPTCAAMGSSIVTRDTTALTPEAPNGQRFSFQKTTAGMATFLIRVSNPGGAAEALTLRVAETTLFSSAWSTFGTFDTFYSFVNTTNASIDLTLKLFNTTGTEVASVNLTVPANQTLSTNTGVLMVPRSQNGSALLRHNGPTGGLLVEAAIANFAVPPGVIQPVKFQEIRASSQAASGTDGGGGGGGGGVQSVTAGDASITIGGTMTDPTVAVTDLGITTAKLADSSVAAAKVDASQVQLRVAGSCPAESSIRVINSNGTVTCETDDAGGTVTGLTEGAGVNLTPDTITTTGSIAVNLGGTGSADTVARSDHTHAVTGSNSTGVGVNALANNSGFGNTALGANALDVNTMGGNNTAVGNDALGANTTGFSNIAVGDRALATNMTGPQNVAVGTFALFDNTSGSDNTALGHHALENNTTATSNTAVGSFALAANTLGASNTALGASALGGSTGSNNTGLGVAALAQNTASGNTAVGAFALDANTSGSSNTAVGRNALGANVGGGANTAVGENALRDNVSANNNTAVGGGALILNTTGAQNTAVGTGALGGNLTTSSNTAVGASALTSNNASGNTAVGAAALDANTSGADNTAVGRDALGSNTGGGSNTAVGARALDANLNAGSNTAVGFDALGANTDGSNNTAVGTAALQNNTMGLLNTAVGSSALLNNLSGTGNTAVGANALSSSTGSNNIGIGQVAGVAATTGSDNIYIGNAGVAAENDTTRIGIQGGQTRAFIAGIRGVTTDVIDAIPVLIASNGQLGTLSSTRRVKEDIRDMGEVSAGLLRLRPVTFRYKKAATDGSKPLQYGLIAEEVAEVMPELVVYDAGGQPQTVQYHVLPALLLNELQRQHAQVNRQEEELAAMRQLLAAQAAELAELKTALRRQAERAAR